MKNFSLKLEWSWLVWFTLYIVFTLFVYGLFKAVIITKCRVFSVIKTIILTINSKIHYVHYTLYPKITQKYHCWYINKTGHFFFYQIESILELFINIFWHQESYKFLRINNVFFFEKNLPRTKIRRISFYKPHTFMHGLPFVTH